MLIVTALRSATTCTVFVGEWIREPRGACGPVRIDFGLQSAGSGGLDSCRWISSS
jgi:hypothetical protein